jgi:hypothetical protein
MDSFLCRPGTFGPLSVIRGMRTLPAAPLRLLPPYLQDERVQTAPSRRLGKFTSPGHARRDCCARYRDGNADQQEREEPPGTDSRYVHKPKVAEAATEFSLISPGRLSSA